MAAAKIRCCPHIIAFVRIEARGKLVLAAADFMELRHECNAHVTLTAASTLPTHNKISRFIAWAYSRQGTWGVTWVRSALAADPTSN